jgi:hypothetical protein
MKKRIYILLVTLLLTLVLAVPASARRCISAEGTHNLVFEWENRTATDINGKCRIQIRPAQRPFEGTVTGLGTENVTILVEGPCEGGYPGKYDDRFWFRGTFEGEVDGREGTCRYAGRGRTWAGDPPYREGRIMLFGCSGELKGMTVVLDSISSGTPFPYSGWVCFAQED